jgi:hypothetical protein
VVISRKCCSSGAFPLGAHVCFSPGDPRADEVLVARLLVRCGGRSRECACSRPGDNWDVVAEMPARVLGLGPDASAVADWALPCVGAAAAWLGAQRSIMSSVLSEAAV